MKGRISEEELEDFLTEIIDDSLDVDWTGRVAAQAIIRRLQDEGIFVVMIPSPAR